ncbi:MAG: SUMF1/EgtB/PvdO family nonheme iron enzyme, partial [Treponema sp.]|nr:SUMF1/EgtB/PvdO family nonheme iron enzyme [Treponema sp.]
ISVQSMLAEINDAGNALNIVVLDACRDFPAAWSRNISRGLSVVANQPADSIIVFATSAGSVAADGTGRNGLFTTHLLTQLRTSGLEVYDLFRRTSSAVSRASNGGQVPAIYSQFFEEAYLGARPAAVVQPPVTPQPPVAVQPTPAPAVTPTPQSSTAAITNELVRIQGGSFIMGSPANEEGRRNNETQRQVTVSSFMMSRYEITQREYREVIGTNPSNFTGDLNRPVESVSWFDAVEYCNRRSQREGLTPAYAISGSGNNRTVTWSRNTNGYRLPTEAEWEYACRAGTTTDYNTGASITASHANFDGIINRTITVGSYAPNAWGLYDMHGNVWEWCWDWYDIPEQRAQTDPRGASSGSYRVLRGGSWSFSAAYVRSAYRSVSTPTIQYYDSGFRVVRNVPGVTTGGS